MKIDELISELIASMLKKESDTLEYFLRDNVIPPIKGKITKGKLTWRGVKLHQKSGINGSVEKQLFQRGKPISPPIVITFPKYLNYNGN